MRDELGRKFESEQGREPTLLITDVKPLSKPASPSPIHPSSLILHPSTWLGAYSEFGLALPAANPTDSQFYAPRAVFLNDDYLVVADSGNHRVLIWRGVPTNDQTPADVVLGQPDFTTEGAKANGASIEKGSHLPTNVKIIDGKLFVADSWHHRILVWNSVPDTNFQQPDYVIGQANLSETTENRGAGKPNAKSFYWCYGFNFVGGWFWVADTGNRRVLGWRGIPEAEQPAEIVLGQDDFETSLENRGGAASAKSFRWAHDIAGNADLLFVADAGNHRVLGWDGLPKHDADANIVIGQPDFESSQEIPYYVQGSQKLRFPYSLAVDKNVLAVADTANNRVLLWRELPKKGDAFPAADAVIGQIDFNQNGENRWQAVDRDTLCWVYGIALHNNKLAVADSGNNRVMIWNIEAEN